jgi:alkylation response protein AidB-like acyl-CoA dehydrogenase
MDFQLSPEQQELNDSVKRLLDKTYEFEARKRIIASSEGHSPTAWAQLAELGVVGLAVPEQRGGYASGSDVAVSLAPVMSVAGESLALEPLASTLVAAWLLAQCEASAASSQLLSDAISGEARIAIALQDDACTAKAQGDSVVLSGEKHVVRGATQAHACLLTAYTGNNINLYASVISRKSDGPLKSIYKTQDSFQAADLSFSNQTAFLLKPEKGNVHELINAANDLSTLLACAEAIGCMRYACDATLDYLKSRKQFGQPIGAFQALQHRMVDMTISLELARSIVDLACTKFDGAMRGEITVREREHYQRERQNIVSAAKIKVSEAARHIGQEAIQLHGGMGMANEMKVSHTFKRLTVIAQTFGDVDFHLARFAATE